MLHTLRSLACLLFCIFPNLLLPAPSLLHLGPEDAGPSGTAVHPQDQSLGLYHLGVYPLRRGHGLLVWSHCPCQGEALRSFTLFCPEVIFQSRRPCHLLEV